MNPLTRQELQTQLQQAINTIVSRTVPREMFVNSMQRVCTKQDAATFIDSSRQKLLERVALPINEQQTFTQQMLMQFEVLAKTLLRLEQKIDELEKCAKTIQTETESVIAKNNPSPSKTVLEQLYA